MERIFLDPGHGGTDPGATASGLREKDLTLDIALAAARRLRDAGLQVRLSRGGDETVGLSARVAAANAWPADLFLSIHINAGGGSGFESFVHTAAPAATRAVGDVIHGHVAGFLAGEGFRDRGRKTADFYVLRRTRMAAVLLECLFIDSAADAGWLASAVNRDRLAGAVAGAVLRAAGRDDPVPGPAPEPGLPSEPGRPPEPVPAPPAEEPAPWAREAWAWAVELGLLDRTRPWDPLTRQEAAVILHRLYGKALHGGRP